MVILEALMGLFTTLVKGLVGIMGLCMIKVVIEMVIDF